MYNTNLWIVILVCFAEFFKSIHVQYIIIFEIYGRILQIIQKQNDIVRVSKQSKFHNFEITVSQWKLDYFLRIYLFYDRTR